MNEAVNSAWQALADQPRRTLAELFGDPGRLDLLATELALPGGTIRFDWSKTHLDAALIAGFERLATAAGFSERRAFWPAAAGLASMPADSAAREKHSCTGSQSG